MLTRSAPSRVGPPFGPESGGHGPNGGSSWPVPPSQTFAVLRFPGDEAGLDFVYLENDRGALYLERPADVARYQTIFDQLAAAALTSHETRKFLAKVRAETGERE